MFGHTNFGNIESMMLHEHLAKMMLHPHFNHKGAMAEMAMPRMDVYQRVEDGAMVVWVELPGMKKDQVGVHVTDDKLTISGRKKYHGGMSAEDDEEKTICLKNERDWGAFYREIPVPRGIEEGQVKAEMDHGLLKIIVPKAGKHCESHKVNVC